MSLTDRIAPLCDLLLGAAYADEHFKEREREAMTWGALIGISNNPTLMEVYQKRNDRWMFLSQRTVHGASYGPTRESVSNK